MLAIIICLSRASLAILTYTTLSSLSPLTNYLYTSSKFNEPFVLLVAHAFCAVSSVKVVLNIHY